MAKQEVWTEEDERQLQEMQQRKKNTQERQSEELLAVIKRYVPIRSGSVSDVSIYDLRNAMVAHGGAFRDALEPFDHMGRPQAVDAMQAAREEVERAHRAGKDIEFMALDDPLGGWRDVSKHLNQQGFLWDTFDYRVKQS